MPMIDSRRMLDLLVALPAIAVFAVVAPVVGLAMWLSGDRGPLLYRAVRIGEGGKLLTVFKFRTMVAGAGGPAVTAAGDRRVTSIGGFLRKHRLDELPQALNLARGDMSVVGPRPEDPTFVDWDQPLHRRVFNAKPGITGVTQLAFRNEAELLFNSNPDDVYRRLILPAKLRLDASYLDRRSMRVDLRILLSTAALFIRPQRRA